MDSTCQYLILLLSIVLGSCDCVWFRSYVAIKLKYLQCNTFQRQLKVATSVTRCLTPLKTALRSKPLLTQFKKLLFLPEEHVHMAETKDIVSFLDILRSYPPGAEMEVKYQIDASSELKTNTRDWVGLFRVGWTSSRDYYTFEWVPQPTNQGTLSGKVKFVGRRLPPEDGHFYQLCYVSKDGTVRGASAPFQFAPVSLVVDDLELVEVTDESLNGVMILQKKSHEMESLRRESSEARSELSALQCTLARVQEEGETLARQNEALRKEFEAAQQASGKEAEVLQGEADGLRGQVEGARGEVDEVRKELAGVQGELAGVQGELGGVRGELEGVKKELEGARGELEEARGVIREREARITEFENQVQSLMDSKQKLMVQLNTTKEQNEELVQDKATAARKLEEYQQRVSSVEGEVVVLTSEKCELQQQLQIQCEQSADLEQHLDAREREFGNLGGHIEALETENKELNVACNELREALETNRVELASRPQQWCDQGSLGFNVDALLAEKEDKIEKLEQDLIVAQQNITELMGARVPCTEYLQHAATPPVPPHNTVDKEAYIVLQQTLDKMEEFFSKEKQEKQRLAKQLLLLQKSSKDYDEMAFRVRECQRQYEIKAQECIELQRRLKKGAPLSTATAGTRSGEGGSEQEKIGDLERAQEQMMQDCEAAASELSMQRAEVESQNERLEQLEREKNEWKHKFQEAEDRCDKKISEKNERLQRLQMVIEEKTAELADALNSKAELEELVACYKRRVQEMQKRQAVEERTCPVCPLKFPSRMSQDDFEKHVQAHFGICK